MKIKAIIRPGLHSVEENTTIKEASVFMAQLKIGAVVVGSADQIQGIISERDIMNKIVAKGLSPDDTTVGQIMTRNIITIDQNQNEDIAMRIMEEKAIRHLPVVDNNGHCVGMLGIRDLMRSVVEQLESENESLSQYIMADGPGG
jgi:CBS domain-containing protein